MHSERSTENSKFLLFHMRKSEEIILQERANFLFHSQLTESELISFDLYTNPIFQPEIIDEFKGFFVGGVSDDPSDDLSIGKKYFPFIDSFYEMIKYSLDISKPGLLSCGGFMLVSALLGGKLTLDPALQELDILEIQFSEQSRDDPLLNGLPAAINILSGHLKSTFELPNNAILLAKSKQCPIHAFKIIDKPFYAFQGHPEINAEQIKERVAPYKDKYFDNIEEYERLVSLTKPTLEANSLLRRFVVLCNSSHS